MTIEFYLVFVVQRYVHIRCDPGCTDLSVAAKSGYHQAESRSVAQFRHIRFRSLQAVRNEVFMTRDRSLPDLIEVGVCAQLVKEWILVHRGIRAVVSLDRKFQHPQSSLCLSAISQMSGKEVVDFGIVVDLNAVGQSLDLR